MSMSTMFELDAMRDKQRINSEVKSRLELLFFDPSKSQADYDTLFKQLLPNSHQIAHSPLYQLRNDMVFCMKNDKWLPAILLADIIVDGLVCYITAQKADKEVSDKDYSFFYEQFCGFSRNEGFFIRLLRNARQHNFGFLSSRVYPEGKSRKNFNKLKKILESESVFVTPEVQFFKLHFPSCHNFNVVASFERAILRSDYTLLDIEINPRLYIEKVESAIKKLKEEIQSSSSYQTNLMNNLTMDNWMRILNRP